MISYSKRVIRENYLDIKKKLMVEIIKLIICTSCVYMKIGNSYLNTQPWTINQKIYYLIKNSGYTWLPAVCYFIQNSLQYTALQNLPSSVYAVLQQLKILTAAIW